MYGRPVSQRSNGISRSRGVPVVSSHPGQSPNMQRIPRRLHVALPLLALPLALSVAPAQGGGGQRVVNPSANQMLSPFRFRNIGPASMGGRIDDIEVSESDPNVIYI